MAYVEKSEQKSSASASFPTAGAGGKGVTVSPGLGGMSVGPSHCTSKRAASNVKQGAY